MPVACPAVFYCLMSNLLVTKDLKTGNLRWILVSSSAWKDRDGEIVTEEALEKAVAHMKATGDYKDLRYWHTKAVLGKGDYADVIHHQLIESGTFATQAIGERVQKQAGQLGASIGFLHPPTQPINGEYHDIKIDERSILPRGKESNLFTRLSVTGGDMQVTKAMLEEKKAGLVELFGDDVASGLLSQLESTAKEADKAGHTRKEAKQKSWWQGVKEALGAIPDPDEEGDEDGADDDTDELKVEDMEDKKAPAKKETSNEDDPPLLTLEQVKEYVAAEFQTFRDEIATLRTKEASTLATKEEVAAVVDVQSTTTKALSEVSTQLKELRGEQPRVFGQVGYRASQAEETKTGEKAKKQDAPKSGISAIREALDSQATGG